MGTRTDLQELLQEAVDKAGQKNLAAKAIGISATRFSRLLNRAPQSYSLNHENSLRLADYLGKPHAVVLRATGKGVLAAKIDAGTVTVQASKTLDPIVHGLAEVLAQPGVEREPLRILVNSLRASAGLQTIPAEPAPRRARRR